jgi:hypothetical protein
MKIESYLWAETCRWHFIPYLQIGIESESWHKSIFIEIGWLNRWNAIELTLWLRKKPF